MTLTGPGGVGKTRLAIEVAERVAGDFADGVAFVDLAPLRDPGLVLGAIAGRLGVDEWDATPLADLLTVSLRGRQVLVLLDNFEHLLPARDAVLTLPEACPRLVLLVTSRVALHVRGGRDYPVSPLVLPGAVGPPETMRSSPAVELLVERARAAGMELALDAETAPAVAEICRRLDGLPLAIELAAARMRLLRRSPALQILRRCAGVLPLAPLGLPLAPLGRPSHVPDAGQVRGLAASLPLSRRSAGFAGGLLRRTGGVDTHRSPLGGVDCRHRPCRLSQSAFDGVSVDPVLHGHARRWATG